MKSALDNIKKSVANSSPAFSGTTQAQIADWESTTNIYIAKIMAMGGYTRNDIFTNIATMLTDNGIVWNDLIPDHHAKLHDYLEEVIAEQARSVASKLINIPFVITAVDPEVMTMVDMSREANAVSGSVPESVLTILRALS